MEASLTAAVGSPVVATMADGQTYTFERATPRILAELGSWHRAQTGGTGDGWTSITDAIELVRTIEGMEWLAYRCAHKHHPEVKKRGPMAFRAATNDFALLTRLCEELTDYPDPQEGDARPPEAAEATER
jgi:hypothetical protein